MADNFMMAERIASLENRGITVERSGSDNLDLDEPAERPVNQPAATPAAQPKEEPQSTAAPQPTQEAAPAAPAAQPTPEAPSAPAFDEVSWVKERTKGKYESAEALFQALAESETKITPETELVRGVNDFIKRGGTVEEYLKTQTTDFAKLSHYDAIKAKLKFDKPFLEDHEIDLMLKREYKIGEDGQFEEDDIAHGKV
jgi:hypothetical protein